jgi:3-hydroxyacyl-CoA dehydrogenase
MKLGAGMPMGPFELSDVNYHHTLFELWLTIIWI